MGVRRRRVRVGGSRTSRLIRWKVPSLFVAIVTLVVVTATALADTPPRSANPLPSNPLPSDLLPVDPPTPASTPLPGRWVIQTGAIAASPVDISCADASHCMAVGAAGTLLSTSDAG